MKKIVCIALASISFGLIENALGEPEVTGETNISGRNSVLTGRGLSQRKGEAASKAFVTTSIQKKQKEIAMLENVGRAIEYGIPYTGSLASGRGMDLSVEVTISYLLQKGVSESNIIEEFAFELASAKAQKDAQKMVEIDFHVAVEEGIPYTEAEVKELLAEYEDEYFDKYYKTYMSYVTKLVNKQKHNLGEVNARSLLNAGISVKEVARKTGLSEKEVRAFNVTKKTGNKFKTPRVPRSRA